MNLERLNKAIRNVKKSKRTNGVECITLDNLAEQITHEGWEINKQGLQSLLLDTPNDLHHALVTSGYDPVFRSIAGWHLVPKEDTWQDVVYAHTVPAPSCKEMKLEFAMGLPVEAVTAVFDDDRQSIIFVQMVGPEQSVRANWAALMGGGKVHHVGSATVKLGGAKDYQRLDTKLKCGWKQQILLHNQLSLPKMDPDAGFFYVLSDPLDGTNKPQPLTTIPPGGFFPRLDKAIITPMQIGWSAMLWAKGIQRGLIKQVDPDNTFGRQAWTVKTAGWPEIITECLQKGYIHIQ